MAILSILLLSLSLPLILLLRILFILHALRHPSPRRPSASPPPYRALAVLGSGGHTAELLTLLQTLLSTHPPTHITYLFSATDTHSLSKLPSLPTTPHTAISTPRAREVHQNPASSLLSTLHCLLATLPAIHAAKPDIVILNGPATAAVAAFAVIVLKALGLSRARVIYVESVARASTLSLSGRFVYHLADRFVVQWHGALTYNYPRAECHGRLT